jgi:type IX secretion system PorP/SprF family membrane protein
MNRTIIALVVSLLLACSAQAQQEAQFTQFMYNKGMYNPAYPGTRGMPSLTAMYRNQWVGMNGAPISQLLSFDMPIFKSRGGLGIGLSHTSIGIFHNWNASLAYAYKLKINEDKALSLGVMASLRHLRIRFTDEQSVALDPDDGSIPREDQQDSNGNFGAGLFYTDRAFFVGVSVPKINNNVIGFNGGTNTARESPHYYFTLGGMFYVEKKIHLKPSMLVKYVKNAPVDFDLNFSAVYDYRLSAGLSYRYGGVTSNFGESLDLLFFYQLSDAMGLGVSYDIPLSKLGGSGIDGSRNNNGGSFEVMLRYDMKNEKYYKDLPPELDDLRRFL